MTLLKPREAAAYLRVSPKMLRRLPVKRISVTDRTVRYNRDDLDAFLKGRAA